MQHLIVLFSLLLVSRVPILAQSAPPVTRVQVIPLPGVEGRIDHMASDPAHKRLYLAALGNNTLEVIDVAAGKRIHTISGFHEPQGIGYAPTSRQLFVANGQSGRCSVYDAASYQQRASVLLGEDADNVRYDGKANRIYIGYGVGAIGILDATSLKRLGTIPVSGHPESFQIETSGPRIFVNVPGAGQVAVLDRIKRTVLAIWPMWEARSNFPMALDEADHRLFIGCRDPAKLLVYDTESGKVVTSFPIVGDTDDVFYDAGHKRLYVTGGAGYLDVFTQESPDRYKRLQHIPTALGARTSYFVPGLSRLYVAVPRRAGQIAALYVFATAEGN